MLRQRCCRRGAGVGCARDDQHVRPALQSPCQADLRRGGLVLAGDREDLAGLGAAGVGLASGSGNGEERHERHVLLATGAQELVLPGAVAQALGVLHANHQRDLLGLGQVLRAGIGYPEVADRPGVAQLDQRASATLRSAARCAGLARWHTTTRLGTAPA